MSAGKNYPWLVGWYSSAIKLAITASKHQSLESVVEDLQRTLDDAETYMPEPAPEVSRARIEKT